MYIVVNRTKEVINFSDLNWVLGPRQSIDLDAIRSRKEIDESEDLKSAVKQGRVQIRHSSVSNTKKESNYIGPLNPSIRVKTPTFNDDYVEKIRVAIREEVENQFKKKEPKTQIVEKVPSEMSELLAQMKQMMEMQSRHVQSSLPAEKVIEVEEDLDINKLSDIHAKSVGKISKDASGQVKYTEQKYDNNLDQNIKDLESLLGED